jgi:hypothetical protein
MSIRNSVFSGAGPDAAAEACWLLAAAVSAAASVVTAPSAAVVNSRREIMDDLVRGL